MELWGFKMGEVFLQTFLLHKALTSLSIIVWELTIPLGILMSCLSLHS